MAMPQALLHAQLPMDRDLSTCMHPSQGTSFLKTLTLSAQQYHNSSTVHPNIITIPNEPGDADGDADGAFKVVIQPCLWFSQTTALLVTWWLQPHTIPPKHHPTWWYAAFLVLLLALRNQPMNPLCEVNTPNNGLASCFVNKPMSKQLTLWPC